MTWSEYEAAAIAYFDNWLERYWLGAGNGFPPDVTIAGVAYQTACIHQPESLEATLRLALENPKMALISPQETHNQTSPGALINANLREYLTDLLCEHAARRKQAYDKRRGL